MEGARFPLEVQERISNMHLYGTDYYDKKDEIDQRINEIEELKRLAIEKDIEVKRLKEIGHSQI